jgi:hypothetical protein
MWLAKEIEGALHGSRGIEIDAWYHFGSWPLGNATLETLENRLNDSDFAILVLSGDDLLQSRVGAPRPAPRDNVIFELGLFMGRLGRDRAFFFFPTTENFKFASDLFGITALPYMIDDRARAQSVVSPLCTQIEKQIALVVDRQRAKGMQERPKLSLNARFPKDSGSVVGDLNHLSASNLSVLKVRVSIDDDNVDDLYVYFDERLNLHKASWTYKMEGPRRFYWAAHPQLEEMKKGGGFISFDVQHPKRGNHEVEVVALAEDKPIYNKKFNIRVD